MRVPDLILRLEVESLGKHALLGRDGTAVELLDLCDCLRQTDEQAILTDAEDER